MSALNFLHAAAGQPEPGILLATVSTTQPLPTLTTQPLYVVEPHAANYFVVIPGKQWIHGPSLPVAGQAVLVFRDNYSNLWCIAP